MVVPNSGRRNPVFYEGESVRFSLPGNTAVRYEVRDYYGTLVDQGSAGATVTLNVTQPGWYKLYLYGSTVQDPWGDSVGGTMFVIFRDHPGFPKLPSVSTPRGAMQEGSFAEDAPTRGILGIGPTRHAVLNASNADQEIARLDIDIGLDTQYYTPYDPTRKRDLLIAFPNGTSDLAGVRKIVDHFKSIVKYWEPRNEPQDSTSGASFVTNEMKPFYDTVKGVDASLKVLGPGTVSVGPSVLSWLDGFFKAGGGQYIDAFSFHAYNNVNGDIWLARKSLDELNSLLAKYNLQNIEKWQTEQGYFAAVYGSYQPRLQGRWTMLQAMVFEQYGIPKEHNYYWYDRSHGFWDFPTWWENEDDSGNGLNPAAALMRVWSEELYGTTFVRPLDFGALGNKLYVGSVFQGSGKTIVAMMSAGSTDGMVDLAVQGGDSVHVVSAFGVAQVYRVTDGRVRLAVSELPSYIELSAGQTAGVIPIDWGPNLARQDGVVSRSSGTGLHPVDPSIPNSITKITNGILENDRWAITNVGRPWMDDTAGFPAWVELDLPVTRRVDRVVVYAFPCWQWDGTLVDYELQYDDNGQWVTVDHVQEPTKTFKIYTPTVRCTVDSFFSDRWIFVHQFTPVSTSKLRLLVHDCTWGGGATKDVVDAGGQTGPHHVVLREVEVYDSSGERARISGVVRDGSDNPVASATVKIMGLSGSLCSRINTDASGRYSLGGLLPRADYEVSASMPGFRMTPAKVVVKSVALETSVDFVAAPFATGSGSGLLADYFNGTSFETQVLQRIDPKVDFQGSWPPVQVSTPQAFSVRWSGQVEPRFTETYTFTTVDTGGERLWVDGELVVDRWAQHAVGALGGNVALTAGARYNITMDYYRHDTPDVPLAWGRTATLKWSSPSQALEVIPQERLYPAAGSVIIPPPNTPPIAVGQAVTVPMNTARAVTIAASDPDGDALAYSVVTQSAHGALSGTAPSLTYTPVAGYSGPDSFTFKANDGKADSNVATVTITVAAGNRAPVATGQTVNVEKDTAKSVSLASADPDGDALTFAIVTNPTHGTLSGTAPDVSYTPAPGYTGDDSFTFKANDGKLDSNIATISINVLEPSRTNIDIVSTGMPRKPAPGDHVQLTVSYTNTSSVDAANVDIRYPVPPHSRYVPGSATAGGVYDSQANEVRWVIPSLSAGASGSASFEIVVE